MRKISYGIVAGIVGMFFSTPSFAVAQGLVPCGTIWGASEACTLCHLFMLIKNIIDWGMLVLTAVTFVILVAMAIYYIVSAGNSQMIETAKTGIKNTLIGFCVVLLSWVIINAVFLVLPIDRRVVTGNWWEISCNAGGSNNGGGGGGGGNNTTGYVTLCGVYGNQSLKPGESVQLKAWSSQTAPVSDCNNPGSATNVTDTATWTSSDISLATVDKGKVTAPATTLGGKNVTITATVNGKSDSGQILILLPERLNLIVCPGMKTLSVRGTVQLELYTHPTDSVCRPSNPAGYTPVGSDTATWTSSDSAKATVNSSGLVTGVSPSSAITIKATLKSDPQKQAEMSIYVQ